VIGAVTRDLLLGFSVPKFLFSLARPVAHAPIDAPLPQALGFPEPPQLLRRVTHAALRLRAWVLRRLSERRRPHLLSQVRRVTDPQRYDIEKLGTFKD
jgi:hypothetical protein